MLAYTKSWALVDSYYSRLLSKSTYHKTGIPIAALDISPHKTHAVLAGRDILRIIRIQGATCTEDFNLRTNIIAYASTHGASRDAVSAQHKDLLAANDVKWSHGRFDTTIATAAANGRIVLYDINRAGVELARLHEHNRQVHKIAFNPHQGALLLSGSQDATIRLWDIRDLAGDRSVLECRSVHKYIGNNEGIRDLRWSPTNGVEFAAGTDNGVIQRWDFRKENAPLLKINAHEKTCHSIDWHPSGKYLASGGADKNVKVWDFESSDRRMKPSWQLRAPQAVMNVRWRPAFWSSDSKSSGSWQVTQLATSYDYHDPRIHIWDFCRPHIPFQEVDRYDTAPTDLLWHSEDLMWSVGTAGMFTQTDMHFVTKTLDRRSMNVVATAPNGQICFFSELRPQRRISLPDAPTNFLHHINTAGNSGDKFSSSHSATDGSLDEASILSSSLKKRRQKTASTRSMGSTPPSVAGGLPNIKFEEAMKAAGTSNIQIAAYGYVHGVFDEDAFKFLAKSYKSPLPPPVASESYDLHVHIQELFDENALAAKHAGKYRVAQSWNLISFMVHKDLKGRAEKTLLQRTTQESGGDSQDRLTQGTIKTLERTWVSRMLEQDKAQDSSNPPIMESSSNMPTPLARPVQGLPRIPSDAGNILGPVERDTLSKTGLVGQISAMTMAHEGPHPKASHARSDYVGDPFGSTLQVHKLKQDLPTIESSAEEISDEDSGTHPKDPLNGVTSIGSVEISVGRPSSDNDIKFPNEDVAKELSSGFDSFTNTDQRMHERRAAVNNYRAKPRPLLRLDEPFEVPRNLSLNPRLDRHDSNESFQMFSASTDSSHKATSLDGSFPSSQKSDVSDPMPQRWDTRHKLGLDDNRASEIDENAIDFTTEGKEDAASAEFGSAKVTVASDKSASVPISTFPPPQRSSNHQPPVKYVSGSKDVQPVNSSTTKYSTSAAVFIPSDFDPPLPELPPEGLNSLFKSPLETPPSGPLTPGGIVPFILEYHLNSLSELQFPAHLTMHLAHLYPDIFPHDDATMILHSYHQQLVSLSMFVEAAALRKHCYPAYPEVWELGVSHEHKVSGFYCTNCNKPVKGNRVGWCERCKLPWAPCTICESYTDENCYHPRPTSPTDEFGITPPFPHAADKVWLWCQGCGHGGHSGCLRTWWAEAESEGACPTRGCLHDCMPGKRREEKMKMMEEEKARTKRMGGMAKRDSWTVEESVAVSRARGVLGGTSSSRGLRGQSGAVSAGLGIETGSGSGGSKKVRLVVPDETGGEEKNTEGEGEIVGNLGRGGEEQEGEVETSKSVP